jgi:hypothetical protein
MALFKSPFANQIKDFMWELAFFNFPLRLMMYHLLSLSVVALSNINYFFSEGLELSIYPIGPSLFLLIGTFFILGSLILKPFSPNASIMVAHLPHTPT